MFSFVEIMSESKPKPKHIRVTFNFGHNKTYEDSRCNNLKFVNLTEYEINQKINQLAGLNFSKGCSDNEHNYFSALNEIRQQIKKEKEIAGDCAFFDYVTMYEEILYQTNFPQECINCVFNNKIIFDKVITLHCGCKYSFQGFIAYIKTFRHRALKSCKFCRAPFNYENFLKQ